MRMNGEQQQIYHISSIPRDIAWATISDLLSRIHTCNNSVPAREIIECKPTIGFNQPKTYIGRFRPLTGTKSLLGRSHYFFFSFLRGGGPKGITLMRNHKNRGQSTCPHWHADTTQRMFTTFITERGKIAPVLGVLRRFNFESVLGKIPKDIFRTIWVFFSRSALQCTSEWGRGSHSPFPIFIKRR